MSDLKPLTREEFVTILEAALEEFRRLNEMDAHLYSTLGLEIYKSAADRVAMVDMARDDLKRTRFMLHSFLCPYCRGPLKAVLLMKERGK